MWVVWVVRCHDFVWSRIKLKRARKRKKEGGVRLLADVVVIIQLWDLRFKRPLVPLLKSAHQIRLSWRQARHSRLSGSLSVLNLLVNRPCEFSGSSCRPSCQAEHHFPRIFGFRRISTHICRESNDGNQSTCVPAGNTIVHLSLWVPSKLQKWDYLDSCFLDHGAYFSHVPIYANVVPIYAMVPLLRPFMRFFVFWIPIYANFSFTCAEKGFKWILH